MKAYKFVSQEVAELIARGSVRLTPAEQFRQSDDKTAGRGDRRELLTSAKIAGGAETLASNHPSFPPDMFVFIKGGERIYPDVEIVGESMQVVADALLYCCSLSDTREIRARMADSFGATAVFEISDINEFGRILASRPELSTRHFQCGPVQYVERRDGERAADLEPVDALHKDQRFSWQDEYRLIWAAQWGEKPLVLEVPEIVPLLHRMH